MAKKPLSPEAENRRNALEYVGAGGALVGASVAADAAVAADRHRRKMDGPIKSAVKGKFTRRHAGQVGVKVGGRAAFAAGAPLAAYGAYRLAKPKEKTPRMDVKRDVAKPLAQGIALKDLADAQARRVEMAKSELAVADQKKLVRRKNAGKNLSIVGGTLGLAALGLRAPEAARALTKVPKLNRTPLKQLATKEPAATKASNTLGIAAIGSGAAGSFNYASQQKLEAKQFRKALGAGHIKGIGRVRVVNQHSKDLFRVLDNKDQYRLVPRGRLTWVKSGKPKAAAKPTPVQDELPFEKADRFLSEYGDRISPKAEQGYKYLKRGRNERAASAGLSAGFAGLSGGLGVHALRRGSKGWAAVGAAGAALNGAMAAREGRQAARWNGKLRKIKAKGKERAAAGQFGPGREVQKSAGQKAEGAAQVAAGGAALGLGLSTNRIMNGAEDRWDRKVNGRYDRMMSSVPLGETKQQKKARGGAVAEINRQRNEALKKNPYKRITGAKGRGRIALITTGFAAGVPNVWLGSRKTVEKADKHDVDAFMGGALAGAGAYHGALYATKRVDRKFAQQVKQGPDFQATERAHRKAYGLGGNTRLGDARWKQYHRTYPKMTTLPQGAEGPVRPMPGAKWKRAMSRAQAGKTQVAITAGVAGLSGLAAAKINRKVDPAESRGAVRKGWFKVKPKAALERAPFVPRDPWAELPAPARAAAPKQPAKKVKRAKKGSLEKRPFAPVDPWQFGKAFGLKLPGGVLKPKLPGTKPRIRQSYIGTSPSGSKFTVRGSVR